MSDKDMNYTSVRRYRKNAKFVSKDKILKTCMNHFGYRMDLLASKKRNQELSDARQVTMYFLAKYTRLSLQSIGNMFGGRDHTTVVHARQTVKDRCDVYENVRSEIDLLTKRLYD